MQEEHNLSWETALLHNEQDPIDKETGVQLHAAFQVQMLDKNKAIDKLIHDFRNPLANIQLLADYILHYSGDSKDASEELQMIIESCQQLNALLDEALVDVKQEIAAIQAIRS